MSGLESPPLTPIEDKRPDFTDREEIIEKYIKSNYRKLTNRINIRDFLPRLREKGFSLADQQVVQHEITSVDKAGKLLDLVIRKDTPCLQVFMEVLEYDYEDLFLKITGAKARERPKSWRQVERNSARLSMQALSSIMDTMSGILSELTKNHNTMASLACQVQGVWNRSSQDQITEEQYMMRVKDTLDRLKAENVAVTWENTVLKKKLEKERQKTQKLSSGEQRMVELRRELRVKEEELHQMAAQGREKEKERPPSSECQSLEQRLRSLIKQNEETERYLQLSQDENKQLQKDLEDFEEKQRLLKERVGDLSEENVSLRTKIDELETHCYWLERKEKRQQTMGNPIYQTPVLKQDEAVPEAAEEQLDPGYVTVNPGRNILRTPSVGARNNISERLSRLSVDLSRLCLSEDSSENYLPHSVDVSDLIGRDFVTLTINRGSLRTISLDGSELPRAIDIAGGNHCGIFVERVHQGGMREKISVGDHLIKLQVAGDEICLGDCTLEEAHLLLHRQTGPVQLSIWSGIKLQEKFSHRKSPDYHGDLFCIQVNDPSSVMEVCGGETRSLEHGAILLVLGTYPKNAPNKWFARKLEPHFGKWDESKMAGYVTFPKAPKLSYTRTNSRPSHARHKLQYSYVQPSSPQYARPVLLFGEPRDVSRILEVVATDDQQFKPEREGVNMSGSPAERLMSQITLFEPRHTVVAGTMELLRGLLRRKIFPIVVRVRGDNGSRVVEDPLKDSDLAESFIEEIELTDKTRSEKDSIKRAIKSLVTQSQRHVIWLECSHPTIPTR